MLDLEIATVMGLVRQAPLELNALLARVNVFAAKQPPGPVRRWYKTNHIAKKYLLEFNWLKKLSGVICSLVT
jgi:hypothetical protein